MASIATASTSSTASHPDDGPHATSRTTEDGRDAESCDPRLLSKVGQKKLSSFPSRQRKMGPAPLASFEDLSMDKTTSDSSSADERNTLPGIGEASEPLSPLSPSTKAAALTVPASPRIRVSAASTSSAHDTDSKDSTPDKELFVGYTKKDYCEEMSDVKTSTEELLAEEERLRRAKEKTKQVETEKYEESLKISTFNRKESSSSVVSENLLPVVSSHSSRLSSLGSVGSNVRRSPSPHRMLLETSFCGNKPIQQPSIDLDEPPLSTSVLLDYAAENLESIRSPTDDREFSESPTLIPPHYSDASQTPSSVTASTKSLTSDTGTPKKSQFQERRDKIDQELSRIHQSSPRKTPERGPGVSEHRSRVSEHQVSTSEPQKRKELSESPESSRSPRLGKKVLPPQVPDLKELRKTGGAPIPPPPPPNSGDNSTTTPDIVKKHPNTTTPTASPKFSKKYFNKKNKENTGTGSGSSTPSTSRKSSFSSLFRRGDSALSPVTPDSPGSVTGRKSPFSELIKSARNEYRSRSRSRSRSKSRDREFDDDSLERKGVLSIFKPKQKKKDDPDNRGDEDFSKQQTKTTSEEIMNVEFTFNTEKDKFTSSADRSLVSSDDPFAPRKEEHPPQEKSLTLEKKRDTSESVVKDHKRIQESAPKEVASPYKSVIEDLEQKQKAIAEKAAAREKQEEKLKEDLIDQKEPQKSKEQPPEVPKKDELQVKGGPDEDSRSESEKESEIEYFKKKQQLGIEDDHSISSDVEIKKLVAHDNGDDDELPYVPTTLPLERSQVTPMIPMKDRSSSLKMVQSIERPRSNTPIYPGRLEQYKESIDLQSSEADGEKINIIIPKKTAPAKSVVRQSSKSWEDFCQEGLKSPRTIRREHRENSFQGIETDTKTVVKHRTRSEGKSPSSRETTPLETPKNWINFEELPDITMKPVKQIKTLQQQKPTPASPAPAEAPRKPKLMSQKRVDATRMNDSYHPDDAPTPRKKLDSQTSDEILPSLRSSTSTPDRDDSSERSSDSERLGSQSSSEELTTIREKIAEIKKREDKSSLEDSSDLERLLAPVNDCIAKLSSLSIQKKTPLAERKSPIPDNWAEFLLPPQPGRRSRLSSLGSEVGSIGGGRSPSPSRMILETSFCGSQPIDDPGFAEPNVPISVARKMSGISLGDLSPLVPRSDLGATSSLHHFHTSDQASVVSDSSTGGPFSPRDGRVFNPHHHRSASEYSTRSAPPAPPRRNLNPFGMDLGMKSNRSSVVSQERVGCDPGMGGL
ncbi:hypothetical protein FHG87_004912 [Trinorchestia longiramus]|nr:hypothetical protein FHG87_004912 [Trinorchestia longiramus]